MKRSIVLLLAGSGLIACEETVAPGIVAPVSLTYIVEASGDPDVPAGVLLRWDAVLDEGLAEYRIYSSPSSGGAFDLRASTTSTSFHDVGVPDLEYYVTAVNADGQESDASNTVVIDERLRLNSPTSLTSTSLDGAVLLVWSDNPFRSDPEGFRQYRLYSAAYSLDNNECDASWSLEGTTVSPEFLVSAMENGVPRCFAASAESIEGFESLWSPLRADTPRPDARNVLIFPYQVNQSRSGFRFFLDQNGDGQAGALELGLVADGNRTDIDFWLDLDPSGDIFIVPERAGTSVALYSTDPLDDLTSIDIAPNTGFSTTAIQAVPGFGYVFQMSGGDAFARYGGLRITHASDDYVIFDWSYQTDPGNPELRIHGGLPTSQAKGLVVKTGR